MLAEVRNRGAPGLLLLTDNTNLSGHRLLYSLIMAALQRAERVHVFGFEVSEDDVRAVLPPELSPSLTFHDGFSDPLGWAERLHSLSLRHFAMPEIRRRVGGPSGPLTIVLHSLSWILTRCPLAHVCRLLRCLPPVTGDTRVVALLHADLHDAGVLQSVTLLADTLISLSDSGGQAKAAAIIQRKKGGRVITCMENFTVRDDFSLDTINEMKREPEERTMVAPTVNLTFNPHLSKSEQERTGSATLPYTFSESKKFSLLQASGGSAKIFYDPEPSDDVDEEDPDDDLDV
ncbi:elongator complex protein 5 [Leptodactylus fuscus]|uniref:elongator complex protein 5 n=1 Tax=Leptodactylus fuscus TaxID=238119 RepID=UPI003F4F327C